jgi:hypothetical protein
MGGAQAVPEQGIEDTFPLQNGVRLALKFNEGH